jgi:putative transposon-encoded protein
MLEPLGTLELTEDELNLSIGVEDVFKKEVTKFGNGAKIGCSKEHLGKTVLVVVCEE